MRAMLELHTALDSGASHFRLTEIASDVLLHAGSYVRIFAKTHEDFTAANLLLRTSTKLYEEINDEFPAKL